MRRVKQFRWKKKEEEVERWKSFFSLFPPSRWLSGRNSCMSVKRRTWMRAKRFPFSSWLENVSSSLLASSTPPIYVRSRVFARIKNENLLLFSGKIVHTSDDFTRQGASDDFYEKYLHRIFSLAPFVELKSWSHLSSLQWVSPAIGLARLSWRSRNSFSKKDDGLAIDLSRTWKLSCQNCLRQVSVSSSSSSALVPRAKSKFANELARVSREEL
jgi:hypothetical protein